MKRNFIIVLLVFAVLFTVCSCSTNNQSIKSVNTIKIRFADKVEGISLITANKDFYKSFSQNDLNYRLQKNDGTLEEFMEFAKEQVLEFTEEQKSLVAKQMEYVNARIVEKGIILPKLEEIVFVNTTGAEQCYPSAYTMGTTIFVNSYVFSICRDQNVDTVASTQQLFLHEIFHCLTRTNKEFRDAMYKLIDFKIQEEDYVLPNSVMDFYISNPDVEHHNASAKFIIDDKEVECFMVMISSKFNNKGDNFFYYANAALIPTDGTDCFYLPNKVSNFYEVFGKDTDYVTDPEEYLADCFAYAIMYGAKGPNGVPYASDVIPSIYAHLIGQAK